MAASSPTDLVAACDEGLVVGEPRGRHLYFSTDGGTTFQLGPGAPPCCRTLASPGRGVAVSGDGRAGPASLLATFDGGATWTTVFEHPGNTRWTDLGFTTPDRGIAVAAEDDNGSGVLVLSEDGGRTWRVVDLR